MKEKKGKFANYCLVREEKKGNPSNQSLENIFQLLRMRLLERATASASSLRLPPIRFSAASRTLTKRKEEAIKRRTFGSH